MERKSSKTLVYSVFNDDVCSLLEYSSDFVTSLFDCSNAVDDAFDFSCWSDFVRSLLDCSKAVEETFDESFPAIELFEDFLDTTLDLSCSSILSLLSIIDEVELKVDGTKDQQKQRQITIRSIEKMYLENDRK